MPKKLSLVLLVLVGLGALVYLLVGNPLVVRHNHQLHGAVTALENGCEVSLDAVVPFPWETVYSFPAYTSRAEIEETIGARSRNIGEGVSEEMRSVIFLHNGKVTASICAYPGNLGYSLDFSSPVSCGDGTVFSVQHRDGIVYLQAEE